MTFDEIPEPPLWAQENEVLFVDWMTRILDWRPMATPYMGTCPLCGVPVMDVIKHSKHHANIWFTIQQLQETK